MSQPTVLTTPRGRLRRAEWQAAPLGSQPVASTPAVTPTKLARRKRSRRSRMRRLCSSLLIAPAVCIRGSAAQSIRVLVDAHPQEMWRENLYTGWLSALRSLSPTPEVADPAKAGLPTVAGSEAWSRRLLNTQLASWAELRHDTILYAKQSYTGGASCEYPSAYVDPYPKFYQELRQFAERGKQVAAQFSQGDTAYFTRLSDVLTTLEEMAQNQRSGAPHSAAHLAFINQAVKIEPGCGEPSFGSGWYKDLFYAPNDAIELDPIIADVHTQPTDEGGSPVGRVLHVGTGMPRVMVVTTNDCSGASTYVGVVSSYFEKITENFERLDDKAWSADIQLTTPADVPWLQDLVVR